MEENYQAAVRRERIENTQTLNFELKYMIVGHITAFQGRNADMINFFHLFKCLKSCLLYLFFQHGHANQID